MITQITFKTDVAVLLDIPDLKPYIFLRDISLNGELKTGDKTVVWLKYAREMEETKEFYGVFEWNVNKKVYAITITSVYSTPRTGFVMLDYDGTPIPDATVGETEVLPLSKIDLINTVNTIHKIETIDLLSAIQEIALIDDLTNVGTLNLLNTVNLIKSISSVDDITNIANIQSVGTIQKILSIESAQINTNPIRNSLFANGFEGWHNTDTTNITRISNSLFDYVVEFNNATGYLYQYVMFETDVYDLFFWAFKPEAGGANIRCRVYYSDGTQYDFEPILVDSAYCSRVPLTPGKVVTYVAFKDLGGKCYLACPMCVLKSTKPREDLNVYSEDVTFDGAGDWAIIHGATGKKIKVYAVGYESSADVDVSLRFGTGYKFFRRVTKGVYAQTLVNPLVAEGVDLNLRAEGAVTVHLWIQYVRE